MAVARSKTIDVRKGTIKPGEIGFFQSGLHALRLKIVKTESGRLIEILRLDNYKAVIPSVVQLGDAFDYFTRALWCLWRGLHCLLRCATELVRFLLRKVFFLLLYFDFNQ
jgi:hypothetical protein